MTSIGDRAQKARDPIALWGWLRGFTIVYLALKVLGATVYALSHGVKLAGLHSDMVSWGDTVYVLAAPIVYLECLFLTFRLTYRLMKNLHEWSPGQVDTSPGWAVGYYIVPIANLYMPPRVVGEIWLASFWQEEEPRYARGIIALWWSTVLITLALSIAASSGQTQSNVFMVQFNLQLNPSQMSPLAALSSALAGLSALFFLNVFGRIAHEQSRLFKKKRAALETEKSAAT